MAKLTVSVTALVVVGLAVITVLSVRSEQQELRLALETRGSAILDWVVVTASGIAGLEIAGLAGGVEVVHYDDLVAATFQLIDEGTVTASFVYGEATSVSESARFIRDRSTKEKIDGLAARAIREKVAVAGDQVERAVLVWLPGNLLLARGVAFPTGEIGALGIALSTEPLGVKLAEVRNRGIVTATAVAVVGAILAMLLSHSITRRLASLAAAAVRIGEGNLSQPISMKSEDEIGVLADAFDEMVTQLKSTMDTVEEERRRAEAASSAKSEFLSSMSHELRTPMNAILGFAQVLESDPGEPLSSSQQESVEQILKAGDHLLALINDVLDLARIEAGRLTVSPEVLSLQDVIEETVSILEPLATTRGIEIEDETGNVDHPHVTADRGRLRQVIMNVLTNAIKYNRDSGLVTLDLEPVNGSLWRLSISDTGEGIPDSMLETIFEPFARLEMHEGQVKGAGIGLAVTKELLAVMGGSITVTSELGKGSRFSIDLPLASAPAPVIEELTASSADLATDRTNAKYKVLYVEDNPANVRLVERILDQRPLVELLTAPQAQMGIELARAHRPDLVVMDIHLPGMDGFEALKRLRADDVTREIPVIALSASVMPRDVEKGLEAGFGEYIKKPLDVSQFLKTIDDILGASDHSRLQAEND